jgi:hypothetical protein
LVIPAIVLFRWWVVKVRAKNNQRKRDCAFAGSVDCSVERLHVVLERMF